MTKNPKLVLVYWDLIPQKVITVLFQHVQYFCCSKMVELKDKFLKLPFIAFPCKMSIDSVICLMHREAVQCGRFYPRCVFTHPTPSISRTQHCWIVICCLPLHTLLYVVAYCWELLFETSQTFSHVQTDTTPNNVASVYTWLLV